MSTLIVPGITGGQIERYADADRMTFTTSAAVLGGQLVEHTTGLQKCQPAGAGSNKCAGLALHDADNVNVKTVTVVTEGVWYCTASGGIAAGDTLICGAAGVVVTAGAAPDARQVIGRAMNDAINGAQVPVRFCGTLG